MNENTKTARAEWESMSGEQQYNCLLYTSPSSRD